MLQFNVHDAKTRFSKMLARVESGEPVMIAKNGRPVAKLVPLSRKRTPKRPFGTAKKLVHLAPDWDAPLPEQSLKSFEA